MHYYKRLQDIYDSKLFYDPGFSVIDAVIVKKASNNYVLV
jgi:hypothetical protein